MKIKSIFGAFLLCLAPFGAQAQEVSQSSSSFSLSDDTLIEVDSVALDQVLKQLADQLRNQVGGQQLRSVSPQQSNLISYVLLLQMLQSRGTDTPLVQYRSEASRASKTSTGRDVDQLENLLEELLLSRRMRQSQGSTYMTSTLRDVQTPGAVRDTVYLQQSNEAEIARLQALESKVQTLLSELKSNQNPSLAQGLNEVQTVVQTDTLTIKEATDFKRSVYFTVGSAKLSERAKVTLSESVRFLNRFPSAKLSLAGYASPEGSVAFNERLANERIKNVLNFLEQAGIGSERLIRQAGAIESTSLGRELGRRVDLSLVL